MGKANVHRETSEESTIQQEARLRLPLLSAFSGQVAEYERYQTLVRRAVSVFGDEIAASRWLSTPSVDFDGRVPLEIARKNSYSLTQFEPIFVRIEHGINV